MNNKTALILREFIRFAERLLGDPLSSDPEASRSFLNALYEYNDDKSIDDNRPFFFVPTGGSTLNVGMDIVTRILGRADENGISDQFKKGYNRQGDLILFFSHAARPFASEMAKLFSLAIVNIGSNGLSLDNFSCQGLFTIRENELSEDLSVARIIIQ